MKKIFFFLAALMLTFTAHATIVECNPGTNNLAWYLTQGDTLVLADGLYEEAYSIDFTKPGVCVKAAEGAKPVIKLTGEWTVLDVQATTTFDGITFDAGNVAKYLIATTGVNPGTLTINNCEFCNWTYWALSNQFEVTASIDSVIINNTLFHDGAQSAISFGNKAPEGTHACNYFKMTNSTIYNVVSTEYAGIVHVSSNGEATGMQNTIIIDHVTMYNLDGADLGIIAARKTSDLTISNTIIANPAEGERASYVYGGVAENVIYYNVSQDGDLTYTNCLTDNPMFVDAANGNFALADGSPALGAGTDGSNLGDPRWNVVAEPEPTTETVYFVNALNWTGTINAYAWTTDPNAAWPGAAATKEAEQIAGYDVYSYTAEAGKYANVIFNGTGGQTADLVWTAGKYYVLDGWYTKEEAEAKLATPIVDEVVYFVNNKKWSKVNAYAWDPANAAWPGAAATKEAEQIGGFDVYSYSAAPGTYQKVIFNDGGSNQTSDMVWTAGKYIVNNQWYTKEEAEAALAAPVVTTWTMVGDKALFGTDWDLNATANDLVKQEDGSWVLTLTNKTLAAKSYEYKAAKDRSWNTTVPGGNNAKLTISKAGQYDVTFTLNAAATSVTAKATYIPAKYNVTVTAENGTVTGAGEYEEGTTATITATPAEGYQFVNWTKGEEVVSTENPYSFVVTVDIALVANFELIPPTKYNVSVTAENGTVEGAGEYEEGTTATLTATPAEGYEFVNWTVGEEVVSTENPYTFTVTADIALVANFELIPVVEPEKPEPTYTENNLNPYAFGLESVLSDDKTTLTVTYRLNNSKATSVNVVIYNGEEVVATVPGTTTIGKNTVEVPTADLPGGVKLTWAVEVNGTSVAAPTAETKIYSFYHPSGLDIDINPENPTFGMLLVNEGMHSVKSKTEGYVSAKFGAGIFAFTPSFDLIPNGELPGYNGGIEFTTGRADGSGTAYSPRRIRISEDGRIFVTSLNTDGNYLWEVNPANMNEWTTVFKGTLNENKELVDAEGNFIAAPNTGFDVKGSGENLQLAMYSVNLSGITAAAMGGFRLHEYNLGTATEWTTAPSKAIVEGKYAINYTGTQVEYDNEGGLWICSYRGAANDANPGLVHINKDGVEDAKLIWSNVRQAGIRFNKDFTKLVVAGNNGAAKKATIYTISKDANGAPVLTQEAVVDMANVGNNLNDFAWDYAGNLYSCGNSAEKLAAWAMPYSGKVETPAASQYAFELDYEKMDVTMTNLEVAEMEGYLVLTASDELNTGLNVMLALNEDGTVSSEMSYATISSGWMETELPILEGTITKTYSEELATDVYSGLVVVLNNGAKFGLNLTMYATPAVDVVIENATITVEELPDGVGGTYELINVSAPWGESMLVIEGIEKNHEGFVQIKEIIIVDGEEDWYIWMCENAVVTTVDNVLTVTGKFKNHFIGVSYNVTISGNLPQGPGTALDNVDVEAKTIKMIKNGQLIIIKNDVQYNVQGQVIK